MELKTLYDRNMKLAVLLVLLPVVLHKAVAEVSKIGNL